MRDLPRKKPEWKPFTGIPRKPREAGQATVKLKTSRVKSVKNLGWLLKHGREVSALEIVDRKPNDGYTLIAYSRERLSIKWIRYEIVFQSYTVLVRFLNRPLFKGLPIAGLKGETLNEKGGM
jgi:hypothetical protein